MPFSYKGLFYYAIAFSFLLAIMPNHFDLRLDRDIWDVRNVLNLKGQRAAMLKKLKTIMP